jgi:DNA-binding NtrC family response regulator
MSQVSKTILIVHSKAAYAEFLRKNIETMFPSLEIAVAESGEAALELVNRCVCDLVITDLVLPGMGGVNLFYELKRRHPRISTILLSDSSDSKAMKVLQQEGLFGYIEKPFLMESLSDLVKSAVSG